MFQRSTDLSRPNHVPRLRFRTKKARTYSILLAALLGATKVSALDYTMRCKQQSLESIEPRTTEPGCAGYVSLGLKCGDTATPNADPKLITLRTPFDSNYANRNSKTYSRQIISDLIRDAVRAGSDPWVLLALIMVEAPPVNQDSLRYLETYGTPPLDSIGAVAAMNCGSREFEDRMQMIVPENALAGLMKRRGKEVKLIRRLGGDEPDLKLTSTTSGETVARSEFGAARSAVVESATKRMHAVRVGNALQLDFNDHADPEAESVVIETNDLEVSGWPRIWVSRSKRVEDCGSKCCIGARVSKGAEIMDPGSRDKDGKYGVSDSLRARLLRALGIRFIGQMMGSNPKLGFVAKVQEHDRKFALTLQGYNGYGIFGVGEPVKNPCLHGINMKTHPVYGAGVAELMLNAVMGNSQLRGMVAKAEAETGHRAKSFYCAQRGDGTFQVTADAFTKLQADFLEGRDCRHSFAMLKKDNFPAVKTADLPTEAVE